MTVLCSDSMLLNGEIQVLHIAHVLCKNFAFLLIRDTLHFLSLSLSSLSLSLESELIHS